MKYLIIILLVLLAGCASLNSELYLMEQKDRSQDAQIRLLRHEVDSLIKAGKW